MVSFFYQLSAAQFSQTPALAVLPEQFSLAISADNSLLVASTVELPLPVANSAISVSSALPHKHVAVLRLFGASVSWQVLAHLLALLPHNTTYACRLYQPHPKLNAAVEIRLVNAVTATELGELTALAGTSQCELVYLDDTPSLRRPGLLLMDMDSTAIQIECIDEIARLAGVGEQVSGITARAMNGELDFTQSLLARVATLKDTPQTVLKQVLDAVPLMPGLVDLVEHLQAHQWHVAIASGGFTYFTDALKSRLGLSATFANVLQIKDGLLTGQVDGEIVDANTKAAVVKKLSAEYGIEHSQTVAIGDGANDIPMLQTAALGVAFHAKPRVQAQARAAIRSGSLLQLLYLLDSE